jgi:hypothetical protein
LKRAERAQPGGLFFEFGERFRLAEELAQQREDAARWRRLAVLQGLPFALIDRRADDVLGAADSDATE